MQCWHMLTWVSYNGWFIHYNLTATAYWQRCQAETKPREVASASSFSLSCAVSRTGLQAAASAAVAAPNLVSIIASAVLTAGSNASSARELKPFN